MLVKQNKTLEEITKRELDCRDGFCLQNFLPVRCYDQPGYADREGVIRPWPQTAEISPVSHQSRDWFQKAFILRRLGPRHGTKGSAPTEKTTTETLPEEGLKISREKRQALGE